MFFKLLHRFKFFHQFPFVRYLSVSWRVKQQMLMICKTKNTTKKNGKKCPEISTWLTFEHLNGHCSRIRPPLKSYCRSLGNLSKSTFTNDFIDGNVMSWNFPGAFCWMRKLVTWTCTLCLSIIFPGFSETHVLWRGLPGCAWMVLT